ncbi:phenylalanyl-tRNA synthetase subunit beta [Kosmotoga arenicorallina S304]|uniref:Phenylalanine--tRNA ligase beta subunit n=1 Tax=Kosmotoga arenicorallina S304 TaxID=1453497 RepID=A0A182C8K6_9BACT|nr:phenylalanine--tRNA ligase subunit beta [Kosmotoga arenicorallina]OAA31869.1 phenylalanyl-tRNA synthetase subunit beta [Kosmotoga arenicorallina S304]
MRISVEWLNDYIDLSDKSAPELANALSLSGTEVESVEYPWNYIEGAFTGRIEAVEDHPNADNLVVTKVNVGEKTYQIVTADKSVRTGEYVAVILSGGKLWNLEIKDRKFRGINSEGMFISLEELKLEEKSETVFRFSEPVETGKDIREALKLNSAVIEVELTANRGDCLSMFGISRELRAIYRKDFELPRADIEENPKEEIEIILDEGCKRYTALLMNDVTVKDSPLWLKRRLVAAGLRPINNVVDITNYVMLETGHPVHAFDADLIGGNRIIVRKARNGEKLTLLDGKEVSLIESDLLITNGEEPLALAGIMGGLKSGISSDTTRVLLEVAVFDPITIRKTARRLGISTDSSYRFERGVDASDSVYVIKRLASMISELSGASVSSKISDVGTPPKNIEIHLRKWFVDKVLGTVVPIEEIENILKYLGFDLEESGDGWDVKVPPYRYDISQEVDLVEEIGRIYGYEKVPSILPRILPGQENIPVEIKEIRRLKRILTASGYNEVINYSFINPEKLKKISGDFDPPMLKNPLSLDLSAMRPNIAFGLLETASYNFRRQNRDLKIFEAGNVFENTETVNEHLSVALLAMGRENADDYTDKRTISPYTFKGTIESILQLYGVEYSFKPASESWLEKRAAADVIVKGEKIGYFGIFDSGIADRVFEIKGQDLFVAELNIDRLIELKRTVIEEMAISPFPRVFRDLSLLIPYRSEFSEIEESIKKHGGENLASVKIMDIYKGKAIPDGYRSITVTLTFESFENTLTDEEISSAIEEIISALKNIGVNLREQ